MTDRSLADRVITAPGGSLTIIEAGTASAPRLVVDGELDMISAPTFSAVVSSWIWQAPARLVLDLGGLQFCGTSGLNALVELASAADHAGTTLALVASHQLRRLLRLLALTDHFPLVGAGDGTLAAR